MKSFFIFFLTLSGMLISLFPGNATVIDFEEITVPNSGNSLDSKGFNFFNDCLVVSSCILHRDGGNPFNADPGGVTYAHEESHSTSTLTQISGDAFDLISIDFADFFNFLTSQTIQVIGTYDSGGTISMTVELSSIFGLETFFFNWEALSQVTWTETSGNWLQLDNVVVQNTVVEQPVASIPAPGSLALFVLAFTGFITARKRHQ